MRIQVLELLANDLTGLHNFYTGTLNLPGRFTTGDNLSLQAGSSQLTFTQAPPGWTGLYHFAFNIPENQFQEAKAWISRRIPLITSHAGLDEFDFEHWHAHAFYFRDPAGNILECIARHDLPNRSDRPFSEQSLLSISEIGLAGDDVLETANLLTTKLGIEVYNGPETDTFTALGDDHGLFIIVKLGRTWFPDTGQTADLYPASVTISNEAGQEYTISGPPYHISMLAR